MRVKSCVEWLLLAVLLAAPVLENPAAGFAVDEPVKWRNKQIELDALFATDLQEIVLWCENNGLKQQAELTRDLEFKRDPRRQYVFLASELPMPVGAQGLEGQWLEKINAAKSLHARRVLELANLAVDEDAGAIAFQLLHEVLHYDRDHSGVRKILGHRKTDEGWKVASDSIRVRQERKIHPEFRWPGGTHILVRTPHFEIESNASESRTRFLAEKLERWHAVWRQLFLEYWSTPAAVKRWMAGTSKAPGSTKRYRVVFFSTRDEYLRQLGKTVRGIEKSTGFYSSSEKTSYFYDGDEMVQGTWRHELTHQLFRESGRTNKNAVDNQFIWIDEGVATYFESLSDFGDYVTLGGFDARRIQYSRIRRLLENFHIPIEQLSSFGRKELQQHPDIERVYSESAGLTDMLINDQEGACEQALSKFLWLIHKGKVKPSTFEDVMGRTHEQLDEQYQEFLKVDSKTVVDYLSKPMSRTELSLPGADLQRQAYDRIAECINLTFLDLSKNSITTDNFVQLKPCQQINRMILTSCSFEEGPLRGLELFPSLNDLDLSGSSVQDDQLESFQNLTNLRSLRLAVTGITDAGLEHLANVSSLEVLDLTRTQVTDQGIANLRQRLPRLQITR